MKKIATKVFLISVSFLLFSGCTNTKRGLKKTIQEVQDTLPVIVDHLNNIQHFEANLQTDWEDDIDEDSTLASYSKKQGKVFENIQNRKEKQKQLNKSLKIVRGHANYFKKVNNKKFPLVEIQTVSAALNTIIEKTEQYNALCDEQLQAEEVFFTEIANNALTAQELREQIKTLNQSAIDRQKLLEEINSPLSTIDKPIRILKARLADGKE